MNYEKFIFIIGLHRSGTSFLHDVFRTQSNITGVKFASSFKYNEGQYLQDILPKDPQLGGMGGFAFNKLSHMTEKSEILKLIKVEDIFNQWAKHWQQPTTNIFVEKSPVNITRTRLLQTLFHDSYFVVILRHPIIQTLSNKKFASNSKYSIEQFIDHWFKAHEILFNDLKYINNKIIFTYEELMNNFNEIINNIEIFLNIKFDKKDFLLNNANKKYHNELEKYLTYESLCNKYGYSVENPNQYYSINDLKQLL